LIVNQILNKGLHTESDECMTFTTTLMDKLERFKSDNPTNDSVHDDVAAQAYVEQFALETLKRAENAMQANKVTAYVARCNPWFPQSRGRLTQATGRQQTPSAQQQPS
jgi:vacuolar protein sorting-associated protein VTA1